MTQPDDPWHPVDPRPKACGSAACVQVWYAGGCICVADSKLGAASPIQRFEADEWNDLLAAVVQGRPNVALDVVGDGCVRLGIAWRNDELLNFTADEWLSFVAGAISGEYEVEYLASLVAGVGAGDSADAAVTGGLSVSAAATGAGEGDAPAPVAATLNEAGPSPVKPEPMSARHDQDPDSMSYTGVEEGESCLPETALTSDNITVPLGMDCVFPGVSGPASPDRPGVEATGTGSHIHTPIRGPVPVAAEDVPAGRDRGAVTPREAPGAVATTGQPGPEDVLAGPTFQASTQGCADDGSPGRPGLSVVDRVRSVVEGWLRFEDSWQDPPKLAALIVRDLVDGALLVDDETYALAHPGPRTEEDEKVWAWATKPVEEQT